MELGSIVEAELFENRLAEGRREAGELKRITVLLLILPHGVLFFDPKIFRKNL